MKLDKEDVNNVIVNHIDDESLRREVLLGIDALAKELEEQKEAEKALAEARPKKELAVVDANGTYWVLQVESDKINASVNFNTDIRRVIAEYNRTLEDSGKGVYMITGLSDAFECIPAKYWKEVGISVKTKVPAYPIIYK